MKNNFLNFLDDVVVENVEAGVTRSTAKKQYNPDPKFLGIRIWKDGSVYPSVAATKEFDLEYPNATATELPQKDGTKKTIFTVVGNQGNGLDIIDVRVWGQITSAKKDFIAVGISPKNSPKIDLFGMTRYDDKGKALTSIMDQGSETFGKKTLLPLIKELYGVEPNEEGFIDLAIGTESNGGKNLRSVNGLELLPKKVSRGDEKGKQDYSKRENIDVYVLYPVETGAISEPAAEGGENKATEEVADALKA